MQVIRVIREKTKSLLYKSFFDEREKRDFASSILTHIKSSMKYQTSKEVHLDHLKSKLREKDHQSQKRVFGSM